MKLLTAFILLAFTLPATAQFTYPTTKTVNQVDDYFGTKVSDPYRWLEDDTSAETKAWARTEQKFTEDYLSKIPFRDKIKTRYKELMNYPKYGGPFKVGDYIFFRKNDGLQNQSVYYYQKGLNGTPEVLIDPNKLSTDGSVSVSLDAPSNDKKYLAYHINVGGSDWQTSYVMDIASHKKLSDSLEWLKFGGASWKGNGFYYSRYPKPAAGTELSVSNKDQKVYYHKLGDNQDKDVLVFEDNANPDNYLWSQVTEDERYLFIYESKGTDGSQVYYKDLTNTQSEIKLLFEGYNYNYFVVNNNDNSLLVYTNNGADNYRIVSVDPQHPEKENWKDVIAEKPEKLDNVTTCGGKLFATYLKDASTKMYQYNVDGTGEKEIPFPGLGSAYISGGYNDDNVTFYGFTSFTYPPSLYVYDITTGKSSPFKTSSPKVNIDDYTTEQVFYTSKDGTKVPMFLVHKKGLKMDGSHPTLLYAYGGFNISLTPYFDNSIFILLENNGIYAMANLRGGGEYGEKWHKAGNLFNKQNVFDDFIAAGEYLISNKYTTKNLLAIEGGSNGGLLIGAVMTQRPDLCKVAFPEVGVMDMLRYQKFTVGKGWAVEFGSSDSANYFPYLYKYSPLHNIKETQYPATMIMTADHDDRVVPAHSFKFAATMQAKQKGDNPILIRIDIDQGHGASGSSLNKVIDETADKWSFMFYNMNVKPKY